MKTLENVVGKTKDIAKDITTLVVCFNTAGLFLPLGVSSMYIGTKIASHYGIEDGRQALIGFGCALASQIWSLYMLDHLDKYDDRTYKKPKD